MSLQFPQGREMKRERTAASLIRDYERSARRFEDERRRLRFGDGSIQELRDDGSVDWHLPPRATAGARIVLNFAGKRAGFFS